MTNPSPPPGWAWWQETSRRYGAGPGADIRVSDAERSAVGDLLSKHYADGRLDDNEFKERLDRAMSAKTRGDLRGLTSDLPLLQPQQPLPTPHRHGFLPVAAAVLAGMFVISMVASAWTWGPGPHVPWLLVLVVGFLVWRRVTWGSWHRHHHDPSRPASPPYS